MENATQMKTRMRADLRTAMKEGRISEAKLIRELIAAIDNAEAPHLSADRSVYDHHHFQSGSAEIDRLALNADRVRALLLFEITEREQAATEMERLAQTDRALMLRTQASFARRYLY